MRLASAAGKFLTSFSMRRNLQVIFPGATERLYGTIGMIRLDVQNAC